MERVLEIYRMREESKASVITRAIDLANSKNAIVIICVDGNTPPVKIHPGDTPEQAAQRMTALERIGKLSVVTAMTVAVISAGVFLLWLVIGTIQMVMRLLGKA